MSIIPNKTKVFTSYAGFPYVPDNLVKIQVDSFKWFMEKGLRELFEEISPITDHTGKELELHFLDYKFDAPKYTEAQSREKDQTYEAALRVNLKLVANDTKQQKTQEVYLGDFPIMTERGTFIINGVERVVILQLIRSPGVYFSEHIFRGKKLFGAKVIPNRGVWLEFETDSDGAIYVKIDRKRKAPVTELLRIFGFGSNEEIISAFSAVDAGPLRHIEATLKKDEAQTADDSYLEIHKRLRPGDLVTVESAKGIVDPMFLRFDRYDLSSVGRFKLNQRLSLKNKKAGLLDRDDLVAIVSEVIRLNNDPDAVPDDIDHLGNRRIRAVGELVQLKLRVGFARLRRGVQDRMSMFDRSSLQPVQLVNYKLLTSVVR